MQLIFLVIEISLVLSFDFQSAYNIGNKRVASASHKNDKIIPCKITTLFFGAFLCQQGPNASLLTVVLMFYY